jgi:hypothetical protein
LVFLKKAAAGAALTSVGACRRPAGSGAAIHIGAGSKRKGFLQRSTTR